MTTMTINQTTGEIVAADLDPSAPARYTVRKAATEPNPPKPLRDLTWRDTIVLDVRGEAALTAPCIDCGVDVTVHPQDLEHDEDATEIDWIPVCAEDQETRELWTALRAQHVREMARRRSLVGA